ncbi:MAG: hypothetical protein M3Z09_13540 [Acidobacteriota bacterium]|nr:hypothetical protein [Acidobacteriota bacterium]
MRQLIVGFTLVCSAYGRDPLAARIAHTEPEKYNVIKAVHAGAGELHYRGLFDLRRSM